MSIIKEFKEFAVKGNAIDMAVGIIIGAAFGGIVKSVVDDLIMPPIGRLVGNLDFKNLYISLSDKIDAQNDALAATQPTQQGMMDTINIFDTASRLPLDKARELGPVIAYGNFLTIFINFLIVAFCVFLLVKAINTLKRKEAVAPTAPPPTPEDVLLLREIRDELKRR